MYNCRPMRAPGVLSRLQVDGKRKRVSLPVSPPLQLDDRLSAPPGPGDSGPVPASGLVSRAEP